MGFWELLEVASAPIIQVLLVSALGAFLASDKCGNLLSQEVRRSMNKIVFVAFTPSLIFASFAKSVSLDDMISWWFMPVNIGFTVIIGGFLGWVIVKLLKPNLKVEGLILASCSTGNMGNLPVVIIPAICYQKGGPFGEREDCRTFELFLMLLSLWRSMRYKAWEAAQILKITPSNDNNHHLDDANAQTQLLKASGDNQNTVMITDTENQIIIDSALSSVSKVEPSLHSILIKTLSQIISELMSPPTIATFLGFLFGGVKWLRRLIIGYDAPLKVIQDTIQLLGDGTIPCITVLLGGNLTQGMESSSIQPLILISLIIARLFILPFIGFYVVRAAAKFGLLPLDPLFQYVLVMQYAMPPAVNISTMAQLFEVGTEESSVIVLWTYGAATISLTIWSTFLMWVYSQSTN